MLVEGILVFLCDSNLFIMIPKTIPVIMTIKIIEVTTIPIVTEPVITPSMIIIKTLNKCINMNINICLSTCHNKCRLTDTIT